MRNDVHLAAAERTFGILLRCYPAGFRQRFEPGMRHAFAAEYAVARARGRRAVASFWAGTIAQAIWFGWAERRGARWNTAGTQHFPYEGAPVTSLFTVDGRDALRALRG